MYAPLQITVAQSQQPSTAQQPARQPPAPLQEPPAPRPGPPVPKLELPAREPERCEGGDGDRGGPLPGQGDAATGAAGTQAAAVREAFAPGPGEAGQPPARARGSLAGVGSGSQAPARVYVRHAGDSCRASPVLTPREVRVPAVFAGVGGPIQTARQHRPSFMEVERTWSARGPPSDVERMSSGPPVFGGVPQSTTVRVACTQPVARTQEQPLENAPDGAAQPRSVGQSPRQTSFRYVQQPRQPVPLLNLASLGSNHQGSQAGIPTVARTARGVPGEGAAAALAPQGPPLAQAPLTARERGHYAARASGAAAGPHAAPGASARVPGAYVAQADAGPGLRQAAGPGRPQAAGTYLAWPGAWQQFARP